jgi:hypothetical protein
MKKLSAYLLYILIFSYSCQVENKAECDASISLPLKIRDEVTEDQFYRAKLILYKVNIALGSKVQAGMPGSELLARKTNSLAELDLIFSSHSFIDDKSIFVFEFEGGIYPSDHPYYNTIEMSPKSGDVEVSESDRFKMFVRKGAYDEDFNSYLDTIDYDLAPFLKCYSTQRAARRSGP